MPGRQYNRSLGLLLVAFGVVGIAHSLRNERVACLYHESRFGHSSADFGRVCLLAEQAYAISPVHHLFWTWVAERARDMRKDAMGPTRAGLTAEMGRWCDRGLSANPWSPPLRLIRAGLLSEQDLRAAIRWWEPCVDWQYWEPLNHAVLAELYAKAGEFPRAFEVLGRIRGHPYATEGRAIVEALATAEAARLYGGRDGDARDR